jgi:hypothetical protein
MLRYNGGREWYRNHRDYLPEDFRSMLESILEEIDQDGSEVLTPEESSSMFAGALTQK